jgi:hypothetical protein
LIEEVIQQATTLTTVTSGQFDTSSVALAALILGMIATVLSIPLAIIKIWEAWTSRTARWIDLLAPKLREIRMLMKQLRFVEADRLYHTEIHGKGFEPALSKISPPDAELPQLFYRLSFLVALDKSRLLKEKMKDKEADVMLTAQLADTARKIVAQIDKILEKAKGA